MAINSVSNRQSIVNIKIFNLLPIPLQSAGTGLCRINRSDPTDPSLRSTAIQVRWGSCGRCNFTFLRTLFRIQILVALLLRHLLCSRSDPHVNLKEEQRKPGPGWMRGASNLPYHRNNHQLIRTAHCFGPSCDGESHFALDSFRTNRINQFHLLSVDRLGRLLLEHVRKLRDLPGHPGVLLGL